MWILLYPSLAAAFPVDVTGVPLAALGVDVDAVVLRDGPHVVVAGAGTVTEVDPFTGATLAPLASSGARAVLLREVGSSTHVIACGNAGLTFDDPVTDDLPTQLSADACAGLLRTDDGFVAIGGPAVRWTARPTGGYASVDLGLDVLGEPIGAAEGDRVAVAGFGDDALQIFDPPSASAFPVGAEIGGVAPTATGWRLGLLDGRIYDLPGTWRAVGEPVGAMLAADLDGDGLRDTVAIYPYAGQLGVFPGDGSAEVRAAAPWGARSLAAADLDGDGCDEVVALDPGVAQLFVVQATVCGGPAEDLDGDGSSAPADCDDGDPDVHPGAPEACDGRDQDCDGEIDETGVAIEAPQTADEGTAPTLTAVLGGCSLPQASYRWTATFTPEGAAAGEEADCLDAGMVLQCTGPDDGTLEVALEVEGDDGAPLGADAVTVEFRNVAPALELPSAWTTYGGIYGSYLWLNLPEFTPFAASLGASDVPTDEVAFAVEGPEYVACSVDGRFTIDGQPPNTYSDEITLVITDDDGGVARWPVRVWFMGDGGEDTGTWWDTGGWWDGDDTGWDDVGDGDGPDITCGGCCCWLLGLAIPIALPPFRRRLRR